MNNEYNNDYWIDRIANETWRTYNSLEARNKKLLEFYTKAAEEIRKEIFDIAFKIGQDTATLSDLHKYKRLSTLNKNMEKIIKELTEKTEKFSHDNIIEGCKKVYENVIVQLKAEEFAEVPVKVIEEMFKRPWAGDIFSKRLWKNSQKLTEVLNSSLLNGIIQGKTFTEIAITLSNSMNTGFNVAHRLVRTETMHYLNESATKGYEDAGIKLVQLWAAEDERTCKTCGSLHGKIYKIDSRPILGLHPGCRCTYIPIVQ